MQFVILIKLILDDTPESTRLQNIVEIATLDPYLYVANY